jgi:hypothetical protein
MNTRPDRDGDEQLRLLDAAWEEAARYWTPLAQQARAYLEALRAMMDMLETAERETDF